MSTTTRKVSSAIIRSNERPISERTAKDHAILALTALVGDLLDEVRKSARPPRVISGAEQRAVEIMSGCPAALAAARTPVASTIPMVQPAPVIPPEAPRHTIETSEINEDTVAQVIKLTRDQLRRGGPVAWDARVTIALADAVDRMLEDAPAPGSHATVRKMIGRGYVKVTPGRPLPENPQAWAARVTQHVLEPAIERDAHQHVSLSLQEHINGEDAAKLINKCLSAIDVYTDEAPPFELLEIQVPKPPTEGYSYVGIADIVRAFIVLLDNKTKLDNARHIGNENARELLRKQVENGRMLLNHMLWSKVKPPAKPRVAEPLPGELKLERETTINPNGHRIMIKGPHRLPAVNRHQHYEVTEIAPVVRNGHTLTEPASYKLSEIETDVRYYAKALADLDPSGDKVAAAFLARIGFDDQHRATPIHPATIARFLEHIAAREAQRWSNVQRTIKDLNETASKHANELNEIRSAWRHFGSVVSGVKS